MWGRVAKIAASLPFLIVAGLFGFYLIFGFFLVNPLAKKLLPWVGENKLASQLSAQQVEFNPLTLEATVTGLKLAEPNGAPLASFERLYLNLDTTGLFRWAWRIQDIQLDKPRATFLVRRGGQLNWQGLIDKLKEDKEPPSDTLPRVLIDHVHIAKGDIEYTDANRVGPPFNVVLAPLGIELDGLSTLPEDRGDYLIAAKLPEQGGTLKWKGDVGLNPIASSGALGLEGVRLTNLLRVIKSPRNFELPSGTLAAGLNYRFAMVDEQAGEDVPWLQVNGANLIVQNLALAHRGSGARALELAEVRVSNANFDLAKRRVDVAGVSLTGGKLAAARDVQGTLDLQTLFAEVGNDAVPKLASAETAAPIAPWKIDVREIKLSDWSARFTDQGFAQPLSATAEGFGLTGALTGEVGAVTAIEVGPISAELGPIRMQSGTQPVAELQRVALVNAGLSLAKNRMVIEAVELSGARTTVTLDKQKNLNWTDILKKAPGAPESAPARPDAAAAAPMDVQLARLSLDGIEVGIVDQSPDKPVRLDIVNGFVTLKGLSLDMVKAIPLKELELQRKGDVPLEAGFALKQGGRLDARGTLILARRAGRLDLRLAGLSLKPFAPYVNRFAKLDLHSGVVSTRGKLAFTRAPSGLKLDYDGGFAVDDLAITEEETAEAFLGWERLSSDSLAFNLGHDRLHINELVAQNPFGRIIIFEDKSINLQRVLRKPAADGKPAVESMPPAEGAKPAAPETPAAPTKSAEPPAFPLAIERLRIVGANAEFADLSLTPQFGTRMHDLGGVVTGLSNDPATTAQVELDGKVDDYGSARVRGSIQPFRATEFTDIQLTFRNLEMARLTPYSGKFAGRRIDSGRLSVDLEYKVKQRQLAGDNKFVINKLKLGERVESAGAMNLPLDLAIALLEDSNGIIDLDLPVSGSLDDPQFSYGKIIWKAIVNVLTKLVTAPFRALGKLLGVSTENLEAVNFDPGFSALMPPEQEKLKTLAEAMAKRPVLTLALEPGFDPEADRRALQEQALRRDVAAGTGVKLAPNEQPGPVDVNNYKVQTWLEDRYAERVGKAEYQKLRASYKAKDGGNPITDSAMVERLGRTFKSRDPGPVSALHAELLEQLTQKAVVDDTELTALAQERGQVMRDNLIKHGLDGGRVNVVAPSSQKAKDKQVGSKMTLGAAGTASSAPATP